MFYSTYMRSFMLSFLAVSAHISTATTTPAYNPKNTVFAWDIDGVSLKMPSTLKRIGYIISILKSGARLSTLRAWYNSTDRLEAAEEWEEFFNKHGHPKAAAAVKHLSDNKTPIEGTVAIIRELHEKGFTQNTATNMGTTDLAFCKTKYDFFNIFAYMHAVNYKSGTQQDRCKKPDPRYFANYFEQCPNTQEHTIFIDDKIENVKAAQAAGMIGLHFKNPEQLREELCKMGILRPVVAPAN